MKPVVVVENLSKIYSQSQHLHKSYAIKDLFREIFGVRHKGQDQDLRVDEFWAVKDISFSLYPGESLALVGKNGSGKSTLLKILHGLIKPDSGRALIDGKMQALINLGAGFDRRLTGKENIFYSAALAGMSRKETEQIYEPVVEFADLGSFIDSPVSTYSSGMYARLGFAVATHLNPDIILIDEILAVGDTAFQNKCFAKMHELKGMGVTMVLVSHSYASVSQFCDRAIWLHEGEMRQDGEVKPVLESYLNYMESGDSKRIRSDLPRNQRKYSKASKAALYGAIYDDLDSVTDVSLKLMQAGGRVDSVGVNSAVSIDYSFKLLKKISDLNVSISIFREDGLLMTTISTLNGDLVKHLSEGLVRCKIDIPDLNLNPGSYVIVMPVHEGHSYLFRDVVASFKVLSGSKLTWGVVNFENEYHVVAQSR